ncbi:hypothetical protein L5515_016331 [Caenorhabditis briggsae]|uniref:Kinase n=2 Tax=Caenorhabditis briggsae TaxID=6238 RepID=A0AAE9JPR8_CAEBR|nr:hypothetical protein L5515_016331 [Caenorhabditis briggsae]
MEYQQQIGGRAEIMKILGDHLLKPTIIQETNSYLKMSRQLAEVAPDCCFVYTNGQLLEIRKCNSCHEPSEIMKIISMVDSDSFGNYLIMRDIAHGMNKPRIIDLKLGTRTHSDFISEEKKALHIRKSALTTTSSLGIRLCGARFTGKHDRQETQWTKGLGKTMSNEKFWNAMKIFFDIPQTQKFSVIRQLLKIRAVIESSPTHRYFGCSILIIIDDEEECHVHTKLIDFASMARSEVDTPQYEDVDEGAMMGVNNLLQILNA